ncbi:MAG: hypothetical protein DI551_10315 [Micavibrio aeruginosavorus]|uniref:Uncharacterized protein n=1 Tax=Micavibrio aeruginosavorus TaxID=349221 RepID=A0A2W5MU68_9BACT|nr:MAG: hypothetical protein DI551_10315 [Micavibrio aeruginosavorus]
MNSSIQAKLTEFLDDHVFAKSQFVNKNGHSLEWQDGAYRQTSDTQWHMPENRLGVAAALGIAFAAAALGAHKVAVKAFWAAASVPVTNFIYFQGKDRFFQSEPNYYFNTKPQSGPAPCLPPEIKADLQTRCRDFVRDSLVLTSGNGALWGAGSFLVAKFITSGDMKTSLAAGLVTGGIAGVTTLTEVCVKSWSAYAALSGRWDVLTELPKEAPRSEEKVPASGYLPLPKHAPAI